MSLQGTLGTLPTEAWRPATGPELAEVVLRGVLDLHMLEP